MTIPFLDLKSVYDELDSALDDAVLRVARSGRYLFGDELDAFEQSFAAYCGVKHCVGLSNGLDALHLALRAWGIGAGDEVIVPAHTFVATWLAVSYAGARPVPVDVDLASANISPELIERAITARTRAILPVHLYGRIADMSAIREIASRRGLLVLEDAAQAHGATFRGARAGSFGDAAAFSFYPGKNLGAFGDAGAVVTNDDALALRVRQLSNYGAARKYEHTLAGFNCRLDEIQAAVLRTKLPRLDDWNARRSAVARRYCALLSDMDVVLPAEDAAGDRSSWHLFVIRCADRAALQSELARANVETLVHYPTPPYLQPAYADQFSAAERRFPCAQRLSEEVLSLPMGPHLGDEQVQRVADAVGAARPSGAR